MDFSPAGRSKPTVSRGLFLGLTITLVLLFVLFLVLTIVFYFLWRRQYAENLNNICPVPPGGST